MSLAKLRSGDVDQILEALTALKGQKDSGFKLTPELIAEIRKLMGFSRGQTADPDDAGIDESIRREAISTLGVYYREKSILPDLVKLLAKKNETEFVLEAVIASIGCMADFPELKSEALRLLAKSALDNSNSEVIRNRAYIDAGLATGRLSVQEWGKIVAGSVPAPAFDIAWLNSLIK